MKDYKFWITLEEEKDKFVKTFWRSTIAYYRENYPHLDLYQKSVLDTMERNLSIRQECLDELEKMVKK